MLHSPIVAPVVRQKPHEPPLVTAQLAPIGGRIGPALDDFRVDEIPAYLPGGTGDHRYVCVEKRGLSTPELVSIVARVSGVAERDIGYAGLKDKHAVTSQWLSLPRRSLPGDQWKLPDTVRILEESYHNNKIRTGHLHGNRFAIRLVELAAEPAQKLPALLAVLQTGLLNAFGEQRFGRGGENIESALSWLADPRGLRGKRARFLSKLYPSVIQSELFNRYLSARFALGMTNLLEGEIVRLEGSGSNFVVQDLSAEQIRYEQGQLHPQGPMFGPKMRPSSGAASHLELEVLSQLGLTREQLDALGAHAPGTRRDVLLVPAALECRLENESLTNASALLSFSLPAGSYATQVIRELCHGPWFPERTNSTQKLPREQETDDESDAEPSL